MKELILITSHTPDNKREDLLRNLTKSIKDADYDIMIVSHTSIAIDIMESVDYFIFDKKNLLLYDIEDKVTMNFENQNFVVFSTETKRYNHCLAFIKLLKLGLTNAKKLNYKKVHFFEYDSLISDFSELEENSKLIDSVGTVFYKPKDFQWPNSPISFNLDKISEEWFQLSDNDFINFSATRYSKLSEEYQMFLIDQKGEYIVKNYSELQDKGIKIGLYVDSDKTPWAVVVCDTLKNELVFFGWNQKQITLEVKVIVNNKEVFIKNIEPNVWTLFKIGDFNEVNHVMIIVNDEIKNVLNFEIINKEKFKDRNFFKIK